VDFDRRPTLLSGGGSPPPPYEPERTPNVVGYGVNILSAMDRDAWGRSGYRAQSGTSMASPYVAGIAALVSSATGLI
jgi:serine protease AprX